MISTSTDGPLYKINPSHHFYSLVSCLSHLEKTTHNIKVKLKPDQLALFRKTKFGHFLDLNIVFNGPLIHYLLLREVEDEGKDSISFLLGGVVCTFGRREFNIITGLWGPKEDYIQLVGNSRLLEKFFKDKECIYVSDLDDIFLEYEGDDDDIVWAYESIPTIIGCGVDKVNDHAIPRMLRWVCQQSPKSQIISQVFDSPMLIIKAVIEMTPEEEQLKIALGELFENFRSSTIVQSKNGGSKRGREVNDEDDFKKCKKQKSKTKIKKAIRNLQDRVAVVEGQLTSIKSDIDELKGMMSTILKHIGLQRKGDEGDRKVSEGLVDHTLESKEVDNAKTEDVDTGGTPNWLRMPKEDEHIELKKKGDEDVHTVGTPPWLRFNIELEKPTDVLEKKIDIGLEKPIDVVDDEVEIEDSGKKLRTHFDEDVTEIEPFPTQRPQVRPTRRKRASVYLSTPFTTLPKRSVTSTTTTSQSEPIVYDPMHKILDVHLDRLRAWITDKRTDNEVLLCLDLVSCQVNVWDSLPSVTTAEEMTNILLPIRELVPKLLDSTGFFDRRGRSSTYKEPWPVVIVDSIPLQRNNSDCGVFTIKYFKYIAAGVGLDTLCQENMSYFRKQLAFQLWTNTPMY
ncbi:hypothetical protein IC582_004351 [Cucumis melo]